MSMIVTRRYPTDLTDAQWQRIRPLIPPAKPGGNNRTTSAVSGRVRSVLLLGQKRSYHGWRFVSLRC